MTTGASLLRSARLGSVLLALLLGGLAPAREIKSLAGSWRLELDPENVGERENWFARDLRDTVRLPGTLDENGRGTPPLRTTTELNRRFAYDGAAWYQHDIEIPAEWAGKRVELRLERTRFTKAWFGSRAVGEGASLSTPHRFVLTKSAVPGRHRLSVRVNNDRRLYPMHLSHVWADRIQTNWNGIVGRIELQATDSAWIEEVQVRPDAALREARVEVVIGRAAAADGEFDVTLAAGDGGVIECVRLPAGQTRQVFIRKIPSDAALWDEFSPALQKLKIGLAGRLADGRTCADEREVEFGLRDFRRDGKKFTINGAVTFLRGKHDAGVFPLTGYAAMDEAGWEKVFRVAASFGINFFRFHSWCPPEAAFRAADRAGVYLQPELPAWGPFDRPGLADYLHAEGEAVLRAYGNHPSFVMLAMGNELGGDLAGRRALVAHLRQLDPSRLYAQGSNNHFVVPEPLDVDDYWTVSATRREGGRVVLDIELTRGSMLHGYLGHLNNAYPASTLVDYASSSARSPVPLLSHETGQYLVFPDFNELPKYTGVLRPYPMEVFKERLDKSGMGHQAGAFFQASGRLAALCYKEDMESVLRTRGMAGYSLLDLQDYPGQGSAWVGMCNAFMEPKSFVDPAWFRQFCAPVVPLLRFAKRTWTAAETFSARVEVAQYHRANLPAAEVCVRLRDTGGRVLAERRRPARDRPAGGGADVATVEFPLAGLAAPAQLCCEVSVEGTPWRNEYDLWVYPAAVRYDIPKGMEIADVVDEALLKRVEAGGTVLVLPRLPNLGATIEGQFIANFWTVAFFKNYEGPGTLGLLLDPAHPVFRHFPTEFHSNWQWWPMARYGRPIILDGLPRTLQPLVQVIDNFETSRKLGLLFEARLGRGRLMFASIDFLQHRDKPEVRQLLFSILRYMESDAFQPKEEVTAPQILHLFRPPAKIAPDFESAVVPGIHA
ncbi:MAG: hypothetical protein PSV13_05410 [Lacunisphaera sp.]|nr:hypothetical protein [Lacunisphaera sp.]